jgi:hypothetical protein
MTMMNRHTEAFSGPGRAHSTGLLVSRGRVVAMASVLAMVPMVSGLPQLSTPAQPHPVRSHLRHVALAPTPVAAMRTAADATGSRPRHAGAPDPLSTARAGAMTPAQDVAGPVSVVGVTWPRGSVSAHTQFQIRTRTGPAWSRWQPLELETSAADPAEAGATSGTGPYVVTGASRYQVRSLTTDAKAPTKATVQVVDPGTSAADSLQQAPGADEEDGDRPAIYTRAQWGADESIRRNAPSYGKVMVAIVHHTDNANTYAAAQVPAMLRAIYSYHVQTLGWSDVGYNFLVDRFGRIWEGRYGGMDRAVVGAQTMNFNSVSTGVSVIGNFEIATVPQVVTNTLKRILAWRLSVAAIPATGKVVANGLSLPRISGHRDANPTDCPGRYLYAKLPEIRTGAAAMMNSTPPAPVAASRGVFSPGDFTGDGRPDLMGITSAGALYLYRGNGTGGFTGGRTQIGAGWGGLTKAFAAGDFTGDRHPDLMGITPAGALYLYRGNGTGGFTGAKTQIGSGWNILTKVFTAGDFTGDGHPDLMGITSAGALYLYRGNGTGGFTGARTQIGSGWNTMARVFSPGDFTGDRKADLLGVTSGGALYLYRGNGTGGFLAARTQIGSGWGAYL